MYEINRLTIAPMACARVTLSLEQSFTLAWPEVYQRFERGADWVIACVHGGTQSVLTLPLHTLANIPVDVILGRHDHCDLKLLLDPEVSLRHLLLRAYRTREGAQRLRIIDLHTTWGFSLEDGPCYSVLSAGDVNVACGAYWIMALKRNPNASSDPHTAWATRPERVMVEVNPLELQPDDGELSLLNRLDADPQHSSYARLPRVTIQGGTVEAPPSVASAGTRGGSLRAASVLGSERNPIDEQFERMRAQLEAEYERVKKLASAKENDATTALGDGARLRAVRPERPHPTDDAALAHLGTLDIPGLMLSLELGVDALAGGLLIGRYERCELRTIASGDGLDSLSRVHLCVLLDETGLWAIDTASTNGCFVGRQPFKSLKLESHAVIELAQKLGVYWTRRDPVS
ncbi:MAG: hypothetical protein AUK47_27590 [Deltaproteobacteria bacterium CG2_30_63_29]|nr:MAG: hypothetical protein AUK47_27590 [Deltaproteobacteria bacterium CG2_30_63_29]